MVRIIIFWIGAITTACLAAVALMATLGWGKAVYDHKKGKRPEPRRKGMFTSRDEEPA